MADTKNTEAPPASEPPAPVQEKTKRGWAMPLISALVVVAALVVGGIGGFAIATATGAGRPAITQGQFPGGPGGQPGQGQQQGPGQQGGGQQGGGQQGGQRPDQGQQGGDQQHDDTGETTDDDESSEG